MQRLSRFCAAGLTGLVVLSGCASVETSNTARTAKEQLLISNAIDRSLNKVNFQPTNGQRVYVEEKYLDSVDKSYLLGSIRHRVLRAGGQLVAKAEEADIVMEVRSGGVGTDTAESYLGVPELVLPGMLTLPEVRLFTRSSQEGYAKVGIVAYDAETKAVLGDGGVSSAKSDDNNMFVLGIGPFQSGSLKDEKAAAVYRHRSSPYKPLPRHVAFGWRQQPAADAEPIEPFEDSPYRFTSEAKEKTE